MTASALLSSSYRFTFILLPLSRAMLFISRALALVGLVSAVAAQDAANTTDYTQHVNIL